MGQSRFSSPALSSELPEDCPRWPEDDSSGTLLSLASSASSRVLGAMSQGVGQSVSAVGPDLRSGRRPVDGGSVMVGRVDDACDLMSWYFTSGSRAGWRIVREFIANESCAVVERMLCYYLQSTPCSPCSPCSQSPELVFPVLARPTTPPRTP